MKTRKITTALALAAVIGAAASVPALADSDDSRFPGKEVEKLTMQLENDDAQMQGITIGAYSADRFPGLAVEQLTRELEDHQMGVEVEPVTTDAPIHG